MFLYLQVHSVIDKSCPLFYNEASAADAMLPHKEHCIPPQSKCASGGMNMSECKRVADSHTTQHYLLMPGDMNSAGVLFGGKLLSWIDMLAGIVALRHADSRVLTVAIDHLEFKKSAYCSDVVTLDGRVTWVGHSSMEVCIDTWRENKGGQKELINTAYVVMVAVEDGTGTPKAVPGLRPETEQELQDWAAGEKRAALRRQRRAENF